MGSLCKRLSADLLRGWLNATTFRPGQSRGFVRLCQAFARVFVIYTGRFNMAGAKRKDRISGVAATGLVEGQTGPRCFPASVSMRMKDDLGAVVFLVPEFLIQGRTVFKICGAVTDDEGRVDLPVPDTLQQGSKIFLRIGLACA